MKEREQRQQQHTQCSLTTRGLRKVEYTETLTLPQEVERLSLIDLWFKSNESESITKQT